MVTIHTTDDFLRAMDENPQWKEAVRRAILTEELMNLPARFDEFVAEQRQIDAEQRQTNATLTASVARLENRMIRLGDDLGTIKAFYARSETARYAGCIVAEMGLQQVRILSQDDLLALDRAGDTSDLSDGELRSYRRADLVVEATDAAGAIHYVVVEVSFTADERDTGRALRNARLLTRFIGHPAHAAIASVHNVNEIRHLIASGQVYWYELDDRRQPEVD